MSFLDMAQELMLDAEAKAAFDADPDAFLASRGFDGLSPADVSDAVGLVADTLPAEAAMQLTDAESDVSGLARIAQLEPEVLEPEVLEPGGEPDFVEHDPSGELDLHLGEDDGGAGAIAADTSPEEEDDGETEVSREWQSVAEEEDPGFGVGYTAEDADDSSPPPPELGHADEHPLDLTLDATHVPDLALEDADPVAQAFAYADEDELADAHHVGHDPGHDPVHDPGHDDGGHHDADPDAHADLG